MCMKYFSNKLNVYLSGKRYFCAILIRASHGHDWLDKRSPDDQNPLAQIANWWNVLQRRFKQEMKNFKCAVVMKTESVGETLRAIDNPLRSTMRYRNMSYNVAQVSSRLIWCFRFQILLFNFVYVTFYDLWAFVGFENSNFFKRCNNWANCFSQNVAIFIF
jgi:hypothetical protein